jgi:hypothetical protein
MAYKIEIRCKVTAENGARLQSHEEQEVHRRLVATRLGEYLQSCGWDWVDRVEDTIVIFRDV